MPTRVDDMEPVSGEDHTGAVMAADLRVSARLSWFAAGARQPTVGGSIPLLVKISDALQAPCTKGDDGDAHLFNDSTPERE